MTIATAVSRNDYTGTGSVNTYPYTFKVFNEDELLVTKELADISSVLILNVDYTVTGVGNGAGGNVVLTANLENGASLTVRRVVQVVQETDIRNQGTYFPEVLEDALDYLTMIDLQQEDGIARSIKLPETEAGTDAFTVIPLATVRASKFFAWDSLGKPIAATSPTAGALVVSAFIETLLDDSSAVLARQTLLLDKHGADIASAATVNLDSSTGDLIDITGSVTVTAITLADGVEKTLRLTGAPLITHGASLDCPGAVSIQGSAGDKFKVRGYASGVVRIFDYLPYEQGILSKIVTTAGDLLVATAARTMARLAVGVAGAFLFSDPAASTKLNYVRLGAGSVRQSVLSSALDANGYAASITTGSGLRPGLDASPTPLVIAYANGFAAAGAQDLVAIVSADASDVLGADLAASNTSFIMSDWASLTSMTWSKTLVPPQYGYAFDRTQTALLHFDGTDASTSIIDDFGNTWTAAGNAQLDTAQTKFGASSLLGDGTGDYVETTNITSLGGDSWEMSCWFRASATATLHTIMSFENASGFGAVVSLEHNAGARRLEVRLSSNGTTNDIGAISGSTTTIALNTWYKVRLVFDALAGTYRAYLSNNGAAESQEFSTASTARICAGTKMRLMDNAQASPVEWNGWLDEFRLIRCATATAVETPKASAYGVNEGNQLINFFSIPEMKMYEVTVASGVAGVNPTLSQRNRVFVGEADTGGAAVTAMRNYALRGQYVSPLYGVAVATTYTNNHNLGVVPRNVKTALVALTTAGGWFPGEEIITHGVHTSNANSNGFSGGSSRNTLSTAVAATNVSVVPKTGGGTVSALTLTEWKLRSYVERGW